MQQPGVVTSSQRHDRGLTVLFHQDLNWLNEAERVKFRLATTVYRCLHKISLDYMADT
jgi:hypothetical protein